MSPDSVALGSGHWALFLDVDGTLLEVAETPQSVHVPDDLRTLLSRLSVRLGGALAMVSGRTIDDIDRLFAPLRFCVSGGHGSERRDATGHTIRTPIDRDRLVPVRDELASFVRQHPGLLLDDKGYGLAVHYRLAPQLHAQVQSIARSLCLRLGPEFALLAGKCVFEIRAARRSKGVSIAELMQQAPFAGRTPVFLGDDLTDEDGFAVVNELGGVSIKVGDAPLTLAQRRLTGVREVFAWLQRLNDGVMT